MTSVPVPDEAASHLGAILMAFNREIFGSFPDEADALAALGQVTSAVLIAGTVLEYVERTPATGPLPIQTRTEIEAWRQLRNRVAHGSAGTLSVEQTQHLIDGVRRILVARDVPDGLSPASAQGWQGAARHQGQVRPRTCRQRRFHQTQARGPRTGNRG